MGVRTARAGSRRSIVVVAGVAVMSLLAGCSWSGSSSSPEPSTTTTTTEQQRAADGSWTSDGLAVHSLLSATKDSIVYAGVDDTELEVMAVDPATGDERWRKPSDVSDRVNGVELRIYTDDTTAYFLTPRDATAPLPIAYRTVVQSPTPDTSLHLSAVETATGRTRWSTPITDDADPNVHRCGDAVCLSVDAADGQELWRFDPTNGTVLAKAPSSLPDGPGDDAMLAAAEHDQNMAQFIVASRGPVSVGQFSANGEHLDWSRSAAELFPGADVSPDGGWGGWSTPTGWVVWLGADRSPTAPDPQPGDELDRGAMAGVAADGTPLWFRAERHPCLFLNSDIPTLCDGAVKIVSSDGAEARPDTIEGIDLATGATTWTVDIAGAIDEFSPSDEVLRVQDDVFLLTTPAGLVRLDVANGPQALHDGDADAVGWCSPGFDASDEIFDGRGTDEYTRSTGYHPCHMGGEAVDRAPGLPIPTFAGVTVGSWSAWVVDGHLQAQQAR